MKLITSRDNPIFKRLKLLAQDSREIRKQGKALLDGAHLVSTYLQRIGLPELLVVSESGLLSHEIQHLIKTHGDSVTLCLKDSLFKEVSPSDTPAGILSIIAIPENSNHPSIGISDCIALDVMQDAGNVGTVIRSALAFGIEDVYLGVGCAGAWTPKVLRAAQGAHFGLRIHERVDLAAMLMNYKGTKIATVVDGAVSLYSMTFKKPTVWVIGNEGQGVSPALVALCDCRVTIPMSKECESLNAAVAASICLSEMARQKECHGPC